MMPFDRFDYDSSIVMTAAAVQMIASTIKLEAAEEQAAKQLHERWLEVHPIQMKNLTSLVRVMIR